MTRALRMSNSGYESHWRHLAGSYGIAFPEKGSVHSQELPGVRCRERTQQLRDVTCAGALAVSRFMSPKGWCPRFVRKAIENGRLLQDLINEAGVRYVSALKNEEPPASRK
jgi:hypothetical protein